MNTKSNGHASRIQLAPAKVSRPASPFQNLLYNTTTAYSSSSSSSASTSSSSYNGSRKSLVLSPDSNGEDIPVHTSEASHKLYFSHSVGSTDNVPHHHLSSARMSRHLPTGASTTAAAAAAAAVPTTAAPATVVAKHQQQFSPLSSSISVASTTAESLHVDKTRIPSHRTVEIDDEDHDMFSARDSTLQVDVMKLPKKYSFQQIQNSVQAQQYSQQALGSPPSASTRSSVLSIIPPMHDVWLDDDDDDDDDDNSNDTNDQDDTTRLTGMLKHHLMKTRQKSSNSSTTVYKYSASSSHVDSTSNDSNTYSSSASSSANTYSSAKPRKSDHGAIFDKLKNMYSRQEHRDATIAKLTANSNNSSSAPAKPTPQPQKERRRTSTLSYAAASLKRNASGGTSRFHRHSSVPLSKPVSPPMPAFPAIATTTSSVTPPLPSQPTLTPQASVHSLATLSSSKKKNRFLSILNRSSGARAVDKAKISAPVNFTHTAHGGGGAAISGAPTSNTPPAATITSASSFVGSPKSQTIMSSDTQSFSTADECSPKTTYRSYFGGSGTTASIPGSSGTVVAPGSRLSFTGAESFDSLDRPHRYSLPAGALRARSRLSLTSLESSEDGAPRHTLMPSPVIAPKPIPAAGEPGRVEQDPTMLPRVHEEGWF